nr:baseplate J/gp47 family protein [Pararoseomonas baculiformis]
MLDRIYDSAFIDTAEGGSLDRLVALVGVARLPAARPLVGLRFERAEREPGRITVPAGTAVGDAAGARYLTIAPLTLEPGESDREVDAVGEADGTPLVEAGSLTRPETLVAGIARVGNPRPARRLAAPESDEQLRRRARGAMGAAGRGTREALEFALAAMPEVRSVRVQEQPDGLPGTVRLEIALSDTSEAARARVQARIDDVRPAGIRVRWGDAARRRLTLLVTLRLAGSSLEPAALASLQSGIEAALRAHVAALGPGAELRRSQLLRLALQDPRVTDATVSIRSDDPAAPEAEQLTLPGDTVAELQAVTFAPPAFEQAPGDTPPSRAVAGAVLPVLPAPGITMEEVRGAIASAVAAHLATRAPDRPLTLDSLAAAIRDDTRFALVRGSASITVEAGSRFLQLTDGTGAYVPGPNERIEAGTLDIVPDDGGSP